MPGNAHNEGTIGIVHNSPGAEAIKRLDVITGAIDLDVGITLAWSDVGRVFGRSNKALAGQHGSPRTRTQVATVSGGHQVVPQLAKQLAAGFGSPDGRPHATSYVPTIAKLFNI